MLSCSHGEVATTNWSTLEVANDGVGVGTVVAVGVGGTAVNVGAVVAVGRGVEVASSPQAIANTKTRARGKKTINLALRCQNCAMTLPPMYLRIPIGESQAVTNSAGMEDISVFSTVSIH